MSFEHCSNYKWNLQDKTNLIFSQLWVVIRGVWAVLNRPPVSNISNCMKARSAGGVCRTLSVSTQTGRIWTEGGALKVSQHWRPPALLQPISKAQATCHYTPSQWEYHNCSHRGPVSWMATERMGVQLRARVWLVLIQHVYVTAICSLPSACSNHIPIDLQRADADKYLQPASPDMGFPEYDFQKD